MSHQCSLMAPDEGKKRFNPVQPQEVRREERNLPKQLKEVQHSSFNRAPGFIVLHLLSSDLSLYHSSILS